MHLRRWLVVAMVAVPCAQAQVPAPAVTPAPVKGATTEAPAKEGTAEAPAPKRRLKFKGERPTCTCASALGEDDIQAAEGKSAAQTQRRSEK